MTMLNYFSGTLAVRIVQDVYENFTNGNIQFILEFFTGVFLMASTLLIAILLWSWMIGNNIITTIYGIIGYDDTNTKYDLKRYKDPIKKSEYLISRSKSTSISGFSNDKKPIAELPKDLPNAGLPKGINITENIEKMVKYKKQTQWEFYRDSIGEMIINMDSILFTMKKDCKYKVLLKVKLIKPMKLIGSKYDFPKNTVIRTSGSTIYTNNLYMILSIKCNESVSNNMDVNERKIKIMQFIPDVMNFINYNTADEFKTNDFIVLAICDDNSKKNNTKEFINALIFKNYELFNIFNIHSKNIRYPQNLDSTTNIDASIYKQSLTTREAIVKTDNKTQQSQLQGINKLLFQLYLPIYDIYNIFLDVYNNEVFVSKNYTIDKDNNEFWNSLPLTEYNKMRRVTSVLIKDI